MCHGPIGLSWVENQPSPRTIVNFQAAATQSHGTKIPSEANFTTIIIGPREGFKWDVTVLIFFYTYE